jgi:hypothetical protein
MWVVGVIIVIALGLYLIMAKSKTSSENGNNVAAENSPAANANAAANSQPAQQSSLKDLLALGTSQKCTFSDSNTAGTFYIASGKSRGDFSSTVAGKATATHMIGDGKTSYVWIDGQKQGFKMSLEAAADQKQANAQPNASQGVDMNKKMNYSCEAWTADNSMFTLPSGIEFVDMSTMMKR